MDKDILVLLSEMLKKQDIHTSVLNLHTSILTSLVEEVKMTNESMVSFFTDQRDINKAFLSEMKEMTSETKEVKSEMKEMKSEMKDIKVLLSALAQLEDRLKAIEERENRFEDRLARIENLLRAS